MIVMSIAEFAAQRRTDQDDLEKDLFPHVSQAIEAYPVEGWYNDLLAYVARLYLDVYHREGGTGQPTPPAASFTADVRTTLDKTQDPTPATVDRISVWLATAVLNAGTQAAAGDDEEFLLMEWVTMHDADVRSAHRQVEGQQRPTTEPYDVAGVEMRYPGDPLAPIELWINCRCSLAPVLASEAEFRRGEGVTMTATETETETVMDAPLAWHGVLAPEGIWSGDGRQFAPDALRFRDLPLPLTWQKATDAGHDGSVVVGRINTIERIDGMMQATGTFLRTPEADEVVGLLAEFGKFGVSVDADDAEFEFSETEDKVTFTSARIASASIVAIPAFAEAYIALGEGAPIDNAALDDVEVDDDADDVCDEESPAYDPDACAEKQKAPAYAVTSNTFKRGPGWVTNPEDTRRLHDYWTKPGEEGYAKIGWGKGGDFNRCRTLIGEKLAENSPEDVRFLNQICAQWHHDALGYWPAEHDAMSTNTNSFTTMTTSTTWVPNGGWTQGGAISLVSSAGPKAPADWFKNPEFTGPTHLTVTEDGRVFGHIAEWTACHIGYEGVCVSPPPSNHNYAYFASGTVLLDNGTSARTGVISLGAGHARDKLRVADVTAHYDSTSTAVADVAVGEDEHGIWCAGWVRPGTSDESIVALRASDVSGDWREIGGELELVAALACNVGGFPTVSVGVEDGVQISLVAAGMLKTRPDPDVFDELAEKVEAAIVARQQRRERMQELATRQERRDRMKELALRFEED